MKKEEERGQTWVDAHRRRGRLAVVVPVDKLNGRRRAVGPGPLLAPPSPQRALAHVRLAVGTVHARLPVPVPAGVLLLRLVLRWVLRLVLRRVLRLVLRGAVLRLRLVLRLL
eukprot:2273878-Rhodomonas_salina.2